MRIRTLTVFFWVILIGTSVATERHEWNAETTVDVMADAGNKVPVTLFAKNHCPRK